VFIKAADAAVVEYGGTIDKHIGIEGDRLGICLPGVSEITASR
jgi:hypothetical protein